MRVKIGNKIIDAKDEPIALIFQSDAERYSVISDLRNMPSKEGIRIYAQFPKETKADSKEVEEFMNIE